MMSRYSRHEVLPQIGKDGQEKLCQSSVLVIGCGSLGCLTASLLARSGIGKLHLVDRDIVEVQNLQHQVLYEEADVGEPKTAAAAKHLKAANSDIEIIAEVKDVNPTNVEELVKGKSIVLDATDNLETRFLLNDACIKLNIPWLYMGAIGTYGMVMPILPRKTACLRCLLPEPPRPGTLPTCETAGVLASTPQAIASIGVAQAMKLLVTDEAKIEPVLHVIDVWHPNVEHIAVSRKDDCVACVQNSYEFLSRERGQQVVSLCGRDAYQITPAKREGVDLQELAARLKKLGEVKNHPELVMASIDKYNIVIFKTGRAIIKGAASVSDAKKIYSMYIGD
jgi:adenylyltransferase/sulfurtransferase